MRSILSFWKTKSITNDVQYTIVKMIGTRDGIPVLKTDKLRYENI